jgi:hypothetical protein
MKADALLAEAFSGTIADDDGAFKNSAGVHLFDLFERNAIISHQLSNCIHMGGRNTLSVPVRFGVSPD